MALHLPKVWILGASFGIGKALAIELDSQGYRLALSARNEEALNHLKSSLSYKHHLVFPLDVNNSAKIQEVSRELANNWGEIDRVVIMSAVYQPMKLGNLELSTVRKIIETNLLSVFNILEVVVPVLRSQNQRSQLAICASAAGYVGLPGSQPYGSSKAGLIHLVESLKAEYGKSIDIKLINPGFVESRLTDKNEFYMPFRITAEKAAKRISSGLNSRKFEIHFPKRFTYLMKIVAFLPYRIYFLFFRQRNDDS